MLVTAYASPATTEGASSAGVWKVVSKPVDFPKLFALVDEAIGQPLVLVVDDDQDLCNNLWDLFREHGLRVSLSHNGREANPQARTILITGHRSEMDRLIEQTIAEGADAVCYKPFDVAELLRKVQQFAGARAGAVVDGPC